MKIGAIIQARMSSSRRPGKLLYEVAGKPMLQYVLERLQHCRNLDGQVVATSTQDDDTPIANFCDRFGISVYRGDLANVARRFLEVIELLRFDAFVRISGDSPLLDQQLVDQAVDCFRSGSFDMVTNLMPRSYPEGQSVEVIKSGVFRAAYVAMNSPVHFEHVTPWFYEHHEDFKMLNLGAPHDWSDIHLAVDTEEDMKTFAGIVARFDQPHWQYGLSEIIEIYESLNSSRVRRR